MRDLTKYRLDSAEERLEVAALMIDVGHNKIFAANISRRACSTLNFPIMSAMLLRRDNTAITAISLSCRVNRRVSNINMRSNSARRSESIWRRFKCESTSALRGQ